MIVFLSFRHLSHRLDLDENFNLLDEPSFELKDIFCVICCFTWRCCLQMLMKRQFCMLQSLLELLILHRILNKFFFQFVNQYVMKYLLLNNLPCWVVNISCGKWTICGKIHPASNKEFPMIILHRAEVVMDGIDCLCKLFWQLCQLTCIWQRTFCNSSLVCVAVKLICLMCKINSGR